jgi:hypothetical protein
VFVVFVSLEPAVIFFFQFLEKSSFLKKNNVSLGKFSTTHQLLTVIPYNYAPILLQAKEYRGIKSKEANTQQESTKRLINQLL